MKRETEELNTGSHRRQPMNAWVLGNSIRSGRIGVCIRIMATSCSGSIQKYVPSAPAPAVVTGTSTAVLAVVAPNPDTEAKPIALQNLLSAIGVGRVGVVAQIESRYGVRRHQLDGLPADETRAIQLTSVEEHLAELQIVLGRTRRCRWRQSVN